MDLKIIPNDQLLSETKSLRVRERETLTAMLHHLREIERRRLFSDLGYKSLFDYTVRELTYSEDQAYRRINAMRMLKEMPQIEEKINDGSLSLSALSVANSMFKAEAKHASDLPMEKKIEVLNSLEKKSRRQAEVIVQSFTSVPREIKPERVRSFSEGSEVRMYVKPQLEEKLEKVRNLIAHAQRDLSVAGVLDRLCDEYLERHEKKMTLKESDAPSPAPPRNSALKRPPISAKVRRFIWNRDQGQCGICGSKHALQIDHILPLSMGGDHSTENLRLLCRSCNQRAAIIQVGQEKMDRYLER